MDEIESWFHNYSDDIYNYLVYYTGKRDVDDLLQETFVKAMRFQHRFHGDSSEKTWLISIARRTALDYFRKQKKWVPWKKSFLKSKELVEKSSEDIILQNEEQQELLALVNRLPRKKRDVVILRGIMELSAKESGRILGWKEARVNVTLHRALKDLRVSYKDVYNRREASYAKE